MQRVVEQHQVVKGVGSRDGDRVAADRVDSLVGVGLDLVAASVLEDVGVDDVEEEGGAELDNQELEHIFFAPIGEVLGFLPVGQLVGFLAVVEGEKMVDFFLVLNHDQINLLILHDILDYGGFTFSRSYAR